MNHYDALKTALLILNATDEELRTITFDVQIQVDGLLLKKLILRSGEKKVADFAIDCIKKGLKDE